MNSSPQISVIMPVFNAERYIAEAVESILAQTFTDFEFLIVDDGSTDRSLEVLQRYAAQDNRIKLRSRPNTGYVVALNEMLADARGEFIARMDADDRSWATRFEGQLCYLESHRECVVVGSATRWIDSDGHVLRVHSAPLGHEEIDAAHLSVPEAVISHPAAMVRAEVFRAVGSYDPNLFGAEDLDLWLRTAEYGQLANLPDVLLDYRMHLQKVGIAKKTAQHGAALESIARARTRRRLSMGELQKTESSAVGLPEWVQHRTWAWWALSSGNVWTARKHAVRAFLRRPLSLATWKVLLCAARGY